MTNGYLGTAKASPRPQPANIGIIGLGRMGQAFGDLLIASGAHVIAYDRDPERAQMLAHRGASLTTKIRDFADCEMILTSLPDDDAVRAVVLGDSGLASFLRPGSVHLSSSTIGVPFCRELDAAHSRLGQHLLAMPVLGNPEMAARRELFIILGGAAEVIDRCRSVIEHLGQRSFQAGDKPWLASAMKLAANMLTAATLESMGEAFAFFGEGRPAPGPGTGNLNRLAVRWPCPQGIRSEDRRSSLHTARNDHPTGAERSSATPGRGRAHRSSHACGGSLARPLRCSRSARLVGTRLVRPRPPRRFRSWHPRSMKHAHMLGAVKKIMRP